MYFEYKKKLESKKIIESWVNTRYCSATIWIAHTKRPNRQRMEKKIILARTEMEDGWIWDSGLGIYRNVNWPNTANQMEYKCYEKLLMMCNQCKCKVDSLRLSFYGLCVFHRTSSRFVWYSGRFFLLWSVYSLRWCFDYCQLCIFRIFASFFFLLLHPKYGWIIKCTQCHTWACIYMAQNKRNKHFPDPNTKH